MLVSSPGPDDDGEAGADGDPAGAGGAGEPAEAGADGDPVEAGADGDPVEAGADAGFTAAGAFAEWLPELHAASVPGNARVSRTASQRYCAAPFRAAWEFMAAFDAADVPGTPLAHDAVRLIPALCREVPVH